MLSEFQPYPTFDYVTAEKKHVKSLLKDIVSVFMENIEMYQKIDTVMH